MYSSQNGAAISYHSVRGLYFCGYYIYTLEPTSAHLLDVSVCELKLLIFLERKGFNSRLPRSSPWISYSTMHQPLHPKIRRQA